MKQSHVSLSFGPVAFVVLAALLSAPGCVSSSDSGGAGGTTGTGVGGASTSAGGNASGGSSAAGGTTAAAGAFACLPPLSAAITDFTYTVGGASGTTSSAGFGDYTTTYSGGTFLYPESAAALASDVSQNNWHIKGTVADYAGFGLFNGGGCTKIDASKYKGISFVVSGSISTGVATSANTLTLSVGTAGDDITSAWTNSNKAAGVADVYGFGRCTPASPTNKYDGTCAQPQKTLIPVTASPTTVSVLWADLTGGKPEASVTPSELVYISWVFPNPTGVGTASVTPYPVDIVIDDLSFIQ